MSAVGREVIGQCNYDMLVADNKHPLDTCHVVLVAGSKHQRGEILEILENGNCDILGTTYGSVAGDEDAENTEAIAENKAAVAAYILAEDVDAEKEDTTAIAYRSGSFIRNALIVKEGYSLTDKDETELRNGGIYLSDAIL